MIHSKTAMLVETELSKRLPVITNGQESRKRYANMSIPVISVKKYR
jgi:hypothetical protein